MNLLKHWLTLILAESRCPNPRLQGLWIVCQLSVLLLPVSTLLSCIGISGVTLVLLAQRASWLSRQGVNRGLAIVAVLMALGTVVSPRPIDAALGLANFLPLFLIFAAISDLIQTPAQLRRLVWLIVLGSLPVVAIGLGQYFLGWAGEVQWGIFNWTILPTGNPPGRMASVFFYANVLASYLTATFTLTLCLWIESIESWLRRWAPWFRSTRSSYSSQNSPVSLFVLSASPTAILLLTGCLFGNGVALALTHSRSAWAIALVMILIIAVIKGWRWLLWAAGLAGGSILWAAFGQPPSRDWLRSIVPMVIWARLTDELYPNRPVSDLRTTQWQFTLDLTQQRPWLGWGLRNFTPMYRETYGVGLGHPHSLPLMLLYETGVPATLLFLGLVGWVVAYGMRQWWHPHQGWSGGDRWILGSVILAFWGCVGFHLFDITLFDIRINLLGWLLLAGIRGVTTPTTRNSVR